MQHVVFEEHFDNNANNWWVGKDDIGSATIAEGHYIFEHLRDEGSYSAWQTLPLVESKAFTFEASFQFLGGYEKNGFGLLWGQKKDGAGGNYAGMNYFVISGSGYYVIRSLNAATGIAEPIVDWTSTSLLNQGVGSINTVKIMRFDSDIDNQLYFLLNDTVVFQMDYIKMVGFEIGFILFQNMKIAIDYFKGNFYYNQV